MTSSISTPSGGFNPTGNLTLRVTPEDLPKLLAHVQKLGTIEQHTTDREDKTTEVIDTEAKIKNLPLVTS